MLPVVTWEAVPSPGPRAERGARAGLLEDDLCLEGNDGAGGTVEHTERNDERKQTD